MNNGEKQAIFIADKYKGSISDQEKVKWLAGEVTELARAIENGSESEIHEEIGDCAFLLLHILNRNDNTKKKGLTSVIVDAADKMEMRNKK